MRHKCKSTEIFYILCQEDIFLKLRKKLASASWIWIFLPLDNLCRIIDELMSFIFYSISSIVANDS